MRKQWLLLSISVLLWVPVAAAEDVYVDLSVLDGIDSDDTAGSAPLFPVFETDEWQPLPRPVISRVSGDKATSENQLIKKTETAKPSASTASSTKSVSKTAPRSIPLPSNKPARYNRNVKIEVPTEPTVNIHSAKEMPLINPGTAESSEEVLAIKTTAESITKTIPEKETKREVVVQIAETQRTVEENATIAEKENGVAVDKSASITARKPIEANMSVSSAKEPKLVQAAKTEASTVQNIHFPDKDKAGLIPKSTLKSQLMLGSEQKQQSADTKTAESFPTVAFPATENGSTLEPLPEVLEPLIPVGEPELSENTIVFENGLSSLSAENQQKLMEMADKFQDPGNNKIMISAYNFDHGENNFKTKRLNLNRAVEIRSYLMTRGYTNFSIKIINTDNIYKENTAEVIEQIN